MGRSRRRGWGEGVGRGQIYAKCEHCNLRVYRTYCTNCLHKICDECLRNPDDYPCPV
ncbi:MAG: hypothetical protein QXI43_00075 [Candidatus Nitrosocaldus sp.]